MQSASLRLVICLCILAMLSHVAFSFQVILERSQTNPNQITLACRSIATSLDIPNANFWLNTVDRGSELSELGIHIIRNNEQTEISFLITQELEGVYFCGTSLLEFSSQADTVTLIGKQ